MDTNNPRYPRPLPENYTHICYYTRYRIAVVPGPDDSKWALVIDNLGHGPYTYRWPNPSREFQEIGTAYKILMLYKKK